MNSNCPTGIPRCRPGMPWLPAIVARAFFPRRYDAGDFGPALRTSGMMLASAGPFSSLGRAAWVVIIGFVLLF